MPVELSNFFIGINDPLGLNPTGATFDPNIFDLYKSWQQLRGEDDETQARLSVARGEAVFNTTNINPTSPTERVGRRQAAEIPGKELQRSALQGMSAHATSRLFRAVIFGGG